MKQSSALTPRKAAQTLRIGLDSVYALIWSGKLRAKKVEGRWMINAWDVDARRRNREAHRGTTGQ